MSLVHGGATFGLFSPCIYNFLCGMDASDLIAGIDEVPQQEIVQILKQVSIMVFSDYYEDGAIII